MKKTLVALLCLFNFETALAQTIDFEDLAGDFVTPVADGYNGLNWNSSNLTGVADINPFLVPGVDYTGLHNNALFNTFGYLAPNTTIISVANGGTFDFLSGVWSAGLTGKADIKFEGYANNQLIYSSNTFNLNGSSVTPVVLNWFGIESLSILSSADVWIADTFEVNINPSAVPAPAAIWLFSSILLGFVGLRRKSSI
jgi:hypothetical protein